MGLRWIAVRRSSGATAAIVCHRTYHFPLGFLIPKVFKFISLHFIGRLRGFIGPLRGFIGPLRGFRPFTRSFSYRLSYDSTDCVIVSSAVVVVPFVAAAKTALTSCVAAGARGMRV